MQGAKSGSELSPLPSVLRRGAQMAVNRSGARASAKEVAA